MHAFWTRLRTTICLTGALLLLSSCSLLALHRDLRAGADAGGVVGTVSHDEDDASLVVVFALREEGDSWAADNYVHLATRHDFLMRLPAGHRYLVGAFVDRNDNLRLDDNEPVVLLPNPVTVAQGWKGVNTVSLTLVPTGRVGRSMAEVLQGLGDVEPQPLPIWTGEVSDLDDDRFSAQSGSMGLWRPFEFLTNVGIGVFFLEAYDATRTPVLFVSGAGGNPREWRTAIDALDRSRYQPWVFVYPSGQRLANSAAVLARCVSLLREKYGFGGLYVTAHSMGGLVARDFIHRNAVQAGGSSVPVFVSFVTPWRGHPAAGLGVQRSPVVVPSWIDMQPDSQFQQAIFVRPLPATTAHYLLYAQTDPTRPADRATDGTIAVSSQLHPDAVREAREVVGFTENHTSVLTSPEVMATYRRILGEPAKGR